MTNTHKKRIISKDDELDKDILGRNDAFIKFKIIFQHVEELRVGETRLASEEDLDDLDSLDEVQN